jgi:hypothetical protein
VVSSHDASRACFHNQRPTPRVAVRGSGPAHCPSSAQSHAIRQVRLKRCPQVSIHCGATSSSMMEESSGDVRKPDQLMQAQLCPQHSTQTCAVCKRHNVHTDGSMDNAPHSSFLLSSCSAILATNDNAAHMPDLTCRLHCAPRPAAVLQYVLFMSVCCLQPPRPVLPPVQSPAAAPLNAHRLVPCRCRRLPSVQHLGASP